MNRKATLFDEYLGGKALETISPLLDMYEGMIRHRMPDNLMISILIRSAERILIRARLSDDEVQERLDRVQPLTDDELYIQSITWWH